MTSNIDITQPPQGNATTTAMRANMQTIKSEIEAIQADLLAQIAISNNNRRLYAPRGGLKPFTSSQSFACPTGYNMAGQLPANGPFNAVRLVFSNPSYVSAATFDSVRIAACPNVGNNGSTLPWSQVTFGGSNTATVPIATTTGSSSDFIPGFLKSDIIALPSVARSDSGIDPLVQIRTYTGAAAANVYCWGTSDADVLSYNAATGREYRYTRQGGAQIADNAAFGIGGTGFNVPCAVEFFYNAKSVQIACVGDSIMFGAVGGVATGSALERACRAKNLAQTSVVYSLQNYAASSQGVIASMDIGAAVIANVKPDYLVMSPYSVNGLLGGGAQKIDTQARLEQVWVKFLNLIETCVTNKIIPVLVTALPHNAATITEDGFRKQINTRINSLSNSYSVLDYSAVLSDGGSPAQYIGGNTYTADGTHPNSAGIEMLRPVAEAFLSSIN